MRITNAMLTSQAMADLNGLRHKYAKAQAAVNGRALERPSEDPQRVVEAMDLSGAKLRLERAMRSGQDAREWLSVTENSLSAMIDQLQEARELAIQAGGPGGLDPDARQSMANQVLAIRDGIVRELNTQHRDQYLFAGWKTDERPFSIAGGAAVYQPDAGQAITRDIAPGLSVAINVTGSTLMAGGNFVKVLSDLAEDIQAGRTQAVTTSRLNGVDSALSHLTVTRSDLGVRQNEVSKYEAYAQDTLFHIEDRLTSITGVDLETAVLRMTEAQTAYQAAVASFAKALPTSLLDYMLR